MNWRPKNWPKVKASNAGTTKREMGIGTPDFSPIFEAGADALLEAIVKQLEEHSYKQSKYDSDLHLNYLDWQALKGS